MPQVSSPRAENKIIIPLPARPQGSLASDPEYREYQEWLSERASSSPQLCYEEWIDRDDERDAVKQLREDTQAFFSALFDWLDRGVDKARPTLADTEILAAKETLALALRCAMDNPFSRVLATLAERFLDAGAVAHESLCTEDVGCICVTCRYPAYDQDTRAVVTMRRFLKVHG